jgi:hypothetical protein
MGSEPTMAWLEERVELLRNVTLPSVRAQTTSEFTWLLALRAPSAAASSPAPRSDI